MNSRPVAIEAGPWDEVTLYAFRLATDDDQIPVGINIEIGLDSIPTEAKAGTDGVLVLLPHGCTAARQFNGSVSTGAPWAESSTIWERNMVCINANVRFEA